MEKNWIGHYMYFYSNILFLEGTFFYHLQWITVNWHSQNSLRYISNLMFFVAIIMFLTIFSYKMCTLGLYVTSNVVKWMFIAWLSFKCVLTMNIILCTLYIYMLICKSCSWWALVRHVIFSSTPAFRGHHQCITKVKNWFQYISRLVY